jgi:cysteine-rich repeat protein
VTREVSFATSPPGLELVVGETAAQAPFAFTFIENGGGIVSAPSPQQIGGVDQRFVAWSDGGARSHPIVAGPGLSTLVATYVSQACGDGGLDAGEECDDGNLADGDCCSSLCRADLADGDGDGVCDARDRCPTVPDLDQLDSDGDGVGQVCDVCPLVPNPRVARAPPPWMTLVSGQRDDDGDGLGNACDFDHDQQGLIITTSDFNELKSSVGQLVDAATCGTAGALRCASFDHDESGVVISAADFNLLQEQIGRLRAESCGAACTPPFGGPGKVPCAGPSCP